MRNKPEIRAVTFDLDGLMFNTEDLYDDVSEKVLGRRGQHFTDELKLKMMGLPGPKAIGVMRQHCGLTESVDHLLREFHDGMFELLPHRLRPMPGLLSLLDLLGRCEVPLSIATSSSRSFLDRTLAISGLADRFQFTLTSDDVTNGKPHPDVYLKSASIHDVHPARMLVLEDSLMGSRAAVAAGAYTIAVPGTHSANLDFSHVDVVIDSLEAAELTALFAENSQIDR